MCQQEYLSGVGAKGCLTRIAKIIQSKYASVKLAEVMSKLAAERQVKNLRASFRNIGFRDIKSNYDLEQWVSIKYCKNNKELDE